VGFELDTTAIERRLEEMAERIEHFKSVDIGNELSDWQVQTMHRHRPFTMRSRARGRAATVIRPHSLYEVKRSAAYQRAMGRVSGRVYSGRASRRTVARYISWEPHTSMRPILRSTLEQELVEQMVQALQDKLKW
jgi:hypothetical protein